MMGPLPDRPTRPYLPPSVRTVLPADPPVLLACTGRYDCQPDVGFPCCKPNANACNGCKPP